MVSPGNGYVAGLDCAAIGKACVVLGGGRAQKEDSVDPTVGLVLHKKVTERVSLGEPLCSIHYNSEERAAQARTLMTESYQIGDTLARRKRPLVHKIISSSGRHN